MYSIARTFRKDLAGGEVDVELVPTENIPEEADVTVGELSVYRHGG